MGIAAFESGETDQVQIRLRPDGTFRPRYTLGLKAELDVPERGPPGEQCILLEDDPAVETRARDRSPIDQDASTAGSAQSAEQVEQGGLTAAARPDQNEEFSTADVQVHVGERGEVGGRAMRSRVGPDSKLLRDVLEFDRSHVHSSSPRWQVVPGPVYRKPPATRRGWNVFAKECSISEPERTSQTRSQEPVAGRNGLNSLV